MEPTPPPKQTQIQIEINNEVAEGTYANALMIGHSHDEFVLDFIRMVPGAPKAKVKSRILVTPRNAKRLLALLADNVQRYEAQHGEIGEVVPQPAVQFAPPGGEA